MSSISSGGYRVASAWQSMSDWHDKYKSMREDFESRVSNASSAFGAAFANQIDGSGTFAAQMALARIQAATKAKLTAAQTPTPPTPAPKLSAFSYAPKYTLSGGTDIDLKANTLTLSNGTQIDLNTGLKVKVDVTT